MVGVTYQEIHLFVEFLKKQLGKGVQTILKP
ncbi:Uncharacterised protein [Streptococcus pneumoniae]|nr:Uncharacterised protein [Streptococcus pneumoniae]